jgi:gluconokinase
MLVAVVMGVAGSGKTTLGRLLAEALGGAFVEGDDFHPPANIAKMSGGAPLDDADRLPWLQALAGAIRDWRRKDRPTVLACSALRQAYRDVLSGGAAEVQFVHLRAAPALIAGRLARRQGHFMPAALLDSQFAALEEPTDAIILDAAGDPAALAAEAVQKIRK